MALLSGCATARITNVTQAQGASFATAPAAILVAVDAPGVRDAHGGTAQAAAGALERDLISRLTKAGVAAGPLVGGPIQARDAVLHVSVTEADPGNRALRLIVGFGQGKAVLQARASLDRPSGDASVLAFDTSSDSGHKPGLILPGGIAAATGNVVHLAIGGGLDLLWTARSGLDRNADQAAKAIVDRLKTYYSAAGWAWPAYARTDPRQDGRGRVLAS